MTELHETQLAGKELNETTAAAENRITRAWMKKQLDRHPKVSAETEEQGRATHLQGTVFASFHYNLI